jgi:hypothetical protein
MNLKDFFAQKESPPELFWSLVLEEAFVQAGIWYIKEGGVAEVIATSPPTPWEEEEELIGSTDAALSSCIQKLPEEFPEPTKTVFGVPSSWISEGEIKEEYLGKIKKICGELSLTPTGFVVLSEAFAHLFKSEEGSPISAVILGLGKENLELSVFKLGNLVGSTQVARSVSLVDDVVEGLSRFKEASPLPSRIIVFDGKEGEINEARDVLSGVVWEEQEKIKFLHTPKVEVLTSERKVLATSLAGASEIGNVSKIETKADEVPLKQETFEENVVPAVGMPSASELGFVVGEDINENTPKEQPAHPQATQNMPIAAATHPQPLLINKFNPNQYLEKTKSLFNSFYGKFTSTAPSQNPMGKKKLITLSAVLGVILIGLFSFWWFYPKASVSIYVSPKKFEKEFEVSFDASEVVTAQVAGEKTKATTGTKQVGDRAKGTVQIRNGTASPINLSAGTIILSAGDLRYSLDNSASVSAALSPSSPGTSAVAVSAEAIGAEYNLAKDETFKVGNYPKAEVDATSTSDFSGGSSRDISAVSKDDQDSLVEGLTNELSEKAKEDLASKATEDQILIDDFVETEIIDQTFNHKVGDEADNLKLSMEMDVAAVVADRAKLAEMVREQLKDSIPSGFVLRDTQITYKFDFDREEDGKFFFTTSVEVNFLPEVKQEDIVKKIAGRTPEVVESYLTAVPGYSRAEIRLRPRFPGPFGTLPRVTKNISIEIVAER